LSPQDLILSLSKDEVGGQGAGSELKERDIQFFRPLWRRVVVTAICIVWAGLELWGRDQLWILITLGLSAYAIWMFFITFPKEVPAIESKGASDVPPQA
jgi:hypothetical protein